MTTIAAALFVLSLTLVALTANVPAVVPAVNRPVESMVAPGAVVDQLTELLANTVLAKNCLVSPCGTEAQVGAVTTKLPPAKSYSSTSVRQPLMLLSTPSVGSQVKLPLPSPQPRPLMETLSTSVYH